MSASELHLYTADIHITNQYRLTYEIFSWSVLLMCTLDNNIIDLYMWSVWDDTAPSTTQLHSVFTVLSARAAGKLNHYFLILHMS